MKTAHEFRTEYFDAHHRAVPPASFLQDVLYALEDAQAELLFWKQAALREARDEAEEAHAV